jgi:hypothetical protein
MVARLKRQFLYCFASDGVGRSGLCLEVELSFVKNDISPGIAVVATILTCAIWGKP